MSEDGFSDGLEEPNMEIQIDTLMGTSFDMRVSALDTVRDIKTRIQRVEGIPIHQQNLIFNSTELKDTRRLCDVGIKNGAIIKLVLAMKGGPISTRRLNLTCEHHVMLKELKELLENTRDELGEKLASGSKVSVLVFKEGEIVNLLRVIENEDGSYSPYGEKTVAPPTKPHRRTMFEQFVEDADMMAKISSLRKKMDDISIKRQARGVKHRNTSNMSYTLLNDVDLKIFEKHVDDDCLSESEEVALKDKHRINKTRHVFTRSLYSESKGALSHTKQNFTRIHKKNRMESSSKNGATSSKSDVCLAVPKNNIHLTRLVLSDGVERPKSTTDSIELEENADLDLWEIHESASERLKHSTTCKLGVLKRRQSVDYTFDTLENQEICSSNFFHVPQFSAIPPQYAPKEDELCDLYFSSKREPLYGRRSDKLPSLDSNSIQRLDTQFDNLTKTNDVIDTKQLAPLVVKKKSRCGECNKRLNITNIYNCRCGRIFCSQHRYSEAHRCNYDYKDEGRRLLEHQNPLVTAEKIHRI